MHNQDVTQAEDLLKQGTAQCNNRKECRGTCTITYFVIFPVNTKE